MIAETILGALSWERDQPSGGASSKLPLKVLQREYPDLQALLSGKSVLDFGCGHGEQSRALAATYGCTVTGLDNNPRVLEEAKCKAAERVRFIGELDEQRYDVVISLNAMEHFRDPAGVLDSMIGAVKSGGLLLITFGPPWYAPYGSHAHFFCTVPWLNLLFPERAIMSVRARYRSDGAKRFEECEGGLNKMSIAKFERLIDRPGVELERRRYTAIKRLNVLTSIPLLRELMTNHVTVVIRKVQ